MGFLNYDNEYFRQIEIFPQGQDNLEYQTFARLIYTQGDFWLQNSPPRGYKILFPYLAGALHLLFGQSSVILYFLNAWCAGLTGKKVVDILHHFKLPSFYASIASLLFFFLLTGPLFYIYYFRFGLIEPVATLCLMLVLFYALRHESWKLYLAGLMTTLFRLDYIGAAFGAIFLIGENVQGSFKATWLTGITFIKTRWKEMITYGISLTGLPAGLIISYFFTRGHYELNASDTKYDSALSVLTGLLKVVSGGTWSDIQNWLVHYPLDILVLVTLLYLGTFSGLFALFLRKGPFKSIDPRLGIIILGYFAVYIFVRPTGYAPRFSTPLLPLALITLSCSIRPIYAYFAGTRSKIGH